MDNDLTAWEIYKANLGDSRPWDILNSEKKIVNDEISNKRFDVCKSCPELINLTKQCKKCGCFMTLKTKIESSKCPMGKW
jgi:hypothetical protein